MRGMATCIPFSSWTPDDAGEVQRAKDAFEAVLDLSLSLGGTIAAEHGIGTLKRSFLPRELNPVAHALQKQLKSVFDPDGRFNPGKAL